MPQRILHCVSSLNATDGGPARSVPSLAQAQAACGAEVILWTAHAPTIELQPFPAVRFVHGELPGALPAGWTPDLIHDHGLWLPSNHSTARFGRHHRVPRVISPRGMLQPWCLNHRRWKKRLAWRLYQHRDLRSADCLHATSAAEVQRFRELGFSQPIIQLPNGVPLPDAVAPQTAPSSKREFLFLSRIHPVKGLENLVTAWSRVEHENWRLRIVGSDEDGHGRVIARQIAELGLQDSVSLEGSVNGHEKWRQMAQADVFVLPSFSENFGIVVAEALAAGTPVITTTGTPWARVREQKCGWWVDPTAGALATGLKHAMSVPPQELEAMGQRGRDWARAEFSWELIGQRMLQAYERLFDVSVTPNWLHRTEQKAA